MTGSHTTVGRIGSICVLGRTALLPQTPLARAATLVGKPMASHIKIVPEGEWPPLARLLEESTLRGNNESATRRERQKLRRKRPEEQHRLLQGPLRAQRPEKEDADITAPKPYRGARPNESDRPGKLPYLPPTGDPTESPTVVGHIRRELVEPA